MIAPNPELEVRLAVQPVPADATPATPSMGERTAAQSVRPTSGQRSPFDGILEVGVGTGVGALFSGFGEPDIHGPKMYREMRNNPTVALARMVANAPIRSAQYSTVAKEDAPAKAQEFIDEQLEFIMPTLLRESVRSRDYGAQHFEKVFAVDGNQLVIQKLKPLLPDKTQVLVEITGAYAGLRQKGEKGRPPVILDPANALTITYDGEAGNFYGRSLMENIKTPWHNWNQLMDRFGKWATMAASPIPLLTYPKGVGTDAGQNERSTFEIAQSILQQISQGRGVTMPDVLAKYAAEMIRNGADPSKLQAWRFTFIEAKGSAGRQMIEGLRYLDSLLMRGWLVPERAATEGQQGTKAEATSHATLVAESADQFLEDLTLYINWYVIDQLLALNWGPEARGTVQLDFRPVNDEQRALLLRIVEKILTQPATLQLFADIFDAADAIEQAGMPVTDEDERDEEGEEDDELDDVPTEDEVIDEAMATLWDV